MKKLIHELGDLKFLTGLYFMAFIMLSSIGSYIHGARELLIITIWQLMGASMVFAGLHYIQLSKLALPVRLTIHSVASYITVILFSLFCNWGFTETLEIFWQFTISFVIIYILIFLAFSYYYMNEEAYLNKKLEEYKEKNK